MSWQNVTWWSLTYDLKAIFLSFVICFFIYWLLQQLFEHKCGFSSRLYTAETVEDLASQIAHEQEQESVPPSPASLDRQDVVRVSLDSPDGTKNAKDSSAATHMKAAAASVSPKAGDSSRSVRHVQFRLPQTSRSIPFGMKLAKSSKPKVSKLPDAPEEVSKNAEVEAEPEAGSEAGSEAETDAQQVPDAEAEQAQQQGLSELLEAAQQMEAMATGGGADAATGSEADIVDVVDIENITDANDPEVEESKDPRMRVLESGADDLSESDVLSDDSRGSNGSNGPDVSPAPMDRTGPGSKSAGHLEVEMKNSKSRRSLSLPEDEEMDDDGPPRSFLMNRLKSLEVASERWSKAAKRHHRKGSNASIELTHSKSLTLSSTLSSSKEAWKEIQWKIKDRLSSSKPEPVDLSIVDNPNVPDQTNLVSVTFRPSVSAIAAIVCFCLNIFLIVSIPVWPQWWVDHVWGFDPQTAKFEPIRMCFVVLGSFLLWELSMSRYGRLSMSQVCRCIFAEVAIVRVLVFNAFVPSLTVFVLFGASFAWVEYAALVARRVLRLRERGRDMEMEMEVAEHFMQGMFKVAYVLCVMCNIVYAVSLQCLLLLRNALVKSEAWDEFGSGGAWSEIVLVVASVMVWVYDDVKRLKVLRQYARDEHVRAEEMQIAEVFEECRGRTRGSTASTGRDESLSGASMSSGLAESYVTGK